jgi:hypothetical protein
MYKKHKITAIIIFLIIMGISYNLEISISNEVAQSLLTFFSIIFLAYMASFSILYNSSYTKKLYQQVYEQRRGIHILKSYLLFGVYFAMSSIFLIILFLSISKKIDGINSFYVFIILIDPSFICSSVLFSIVCVNIYYMLLLAREIINCILEEAKNGSY